MHSRSLHPLARTDVRIGLPLPWPVFDQNHRLLLREGAVIESANQLEHLLNGGLFRPRDVRQEPGDAVTRASPSTSPLNASGSHPRLPEMPPMSFAETGLHPGISIQMATGHANAERIYVRLVGYMEKRSLIVSHPEYEGNLLFVKDGTGYDCKAFHGKRVFHFHTTAMHSQMQPYPYLHLVYPDKVSATAVRASHRIKTQIIASIAFPNRKSPCPCTIRDLALNGAQIRLPQMDCAIGVRVQLAFRLAIDDETPLFEIPAEVKRAHPFVSEAGFESLELGVQFMELAIERRRLLEIYLNRALLAGLEPALS